MKSFLMIIFVSIISLNVYSFSLNRIYANDQKETFISRALLEKIKELSVTYYIWETDINKLEENDVILNIYHETELNMMKVNGEFNGGNFEIETEIQDRQEWVLFFSVQILEKIASQRFLYDNTWEFLQLTFWNGVDEYPIFLNNKIYYVSNRYTGNRGIHIWDLETGEKNNLDLKNSSEYFPDISPNERYLAFQTSLFGKWDIVIYDIIENTYKRITPANGRSAYSPYFYNNTLMMYVMDSKNGRTTEFYIYDLLTGESELFFAQENLMKFRPARWNSNKIVFYAIDLETAVTNIYYIDENKKAVPLIKTERNEIDSWSDSSDLIIFSRFENGYYRIFAYENEETRMITKSLNNDAYYPTYSPDKQFIFFTHYYRELDPDIYVYRNVRE
jgi:TolB protein